jgi:signal transduction histidine kinase
MDVWEGLSDTRLGVVEALVSQEALLPLGAVPPEAAGMVIAFFDPSGERSLRPLPFDPAILEEREFQWGGDQWVTLRRSLQEPPVTVVVASPVSPLLGPFQQAAQRGTLLLLAVALVGFMAAVALSRRLTRSLEGLSEAAQAVSKGDLRRRIQESGEDEVGQVAEAFNVMTESLQQTLEELARAESLAAVGEFAASLAHEIRNPLTAIRIDLQRALTDLPSHSQMRRPLQRSLDEIDTLNLTIEGTLAQARLGPVGMETVDLRDILESGQEAAHPFFEERGASLILDLGRAPLAVRGDADTLRQVFLNVFRNAAEALGPGGEAKVEVADEDDDVHITITDSGSGIPEELHDRIFEPLFTTRAAGTGLGLTIVRRIVEAHSGKVTLESASGRGTTVKVRLPKM